jgi:hypothetical protein
VATGALLTTTGIGAKAETRTEQGAATQTVKAMRAERLTGTVKATKVNLARSVVPIVTSGGMIALTLDPVGGVTSVRGEATTRRDFRRIAARVEMPNRVADVRNQASAINAVLVAVAVRMAPNGRIVKVTEHELRS